MEHTCIFCGNTFIIPYLDENALSVSDVEGSTVTCHECENDMIAINGKWEDFAAYLNESFREYYDKVKMHNI